MEIIINLVVSRGKYVKKKTRRTVMIIIIITHRILEYRTQ